jgi:hypothetical protein
MWVGEMEKKNFKSIPEYEKTMTIEPGNSLNVSGVEMWIYFRWPMIARFPLVGFSPINVC